MTHTLFLSTLVSGLLHNASHESFPNPFPPIQHDRSFKDKEDADFHMNFPNPSVLEHVVMPGDTIQGICLRYRVSAVELRRHNNFSGNNDGDYDDTYGVPCKKWLYFA